MRLSPGPEPRRLPRPVAAAALVVWVAVIIGGFGFLTGYGGRAGPIGAAPAAWPVDSALQHGAGLELLAFVHPLCPCTRASLEALDRTLHLAGRPVRTRVVVVGPHDGSEGIVARARRLPGAVVVGDASGAEARRFGAATSGHVVAYAGGALVFSGGVTPSRGHEGTSSGCDELRAALEGRVPSPAQRPVFGCGLFDPDAERAPGGTP